MIYIYIGSGKWKWTPSGSKISIFKCLAVMPKKVSWAVCKGWGRCLCPLWLRWANWRDCRIDFFRFRSHWGSCIWCRRGRWGSRGWRGQHTGRRHTWVVGRASRLNLENFTDAILPRICTFRPTPELTRGPGWWSVVQLFVHLQPHHNILQLTTSYLIMKWWVNGKRVSEPS